MAIRLTQQVLLTGYATDPAARVSAIAQEVVNRQQPAVRMTGIAVEVIRSAASVGGNNIRPQQFIICSG